MKDVVTSLIDVPFARMFVLSGIIFLLIAVLGKVEGKIEPGNIGRLGATILGVVLMIIGVAMQYVEIRETAMEKVAQRTQSVAVPAAAPAAIQAETAVPPTADKPTIRVVSGTYGRSCNAKAGNATAQLTKDCEGHAACDFAVETISMEDPAPNCSKDFAAEWKCGSGSTVYSAILPATAGKGEKLHLACAG